MEEAERDCTTTLLVSGGTARVGCPHHKHPHLPWPCEHPLTRARVGMITKVMEESDIDPASEGFNKARHGKACDGKSGWTHYPGDGCLPYCQRGRDSTGEFCRRCFLQDSQPNLGRMTGLMSWRTKLQLVAMKLFCEKKPRGSWQGQTNHSSALESSSHGIACAQQACASVQKQEA